MSTARPTSFTQSEKPPNDPFYLGRRLVNRGTYYEEIPLTLEDVLHPQEEDRVTVNDLHTQLCPYLRNVMQRQVAAIPNAVVVADLRIAWDDPDLKPHGPDIGVIFNVKERKHWSTFDVAQEGTRPVLLIEVTSPATRDLDFGIKVTEYEQAGVEYYVIVDIVPTRGVTTPRLIGYRLTASGYAPLAPDARNALWLEPVRTWIRVIDGEVICEDEQGQPIPDYLELDSARESAATALEQAEARIRELEAELRRRDEQKRRADSRLPR